MVDNELWRFKHHEQVLANGIASLSKARNLSYTLVPINRLPQPLLLSAFSYAINPEYTKRTRLPQPLFQEQTHPTLTVSSVCSSWRRLVLESPVLWSTILFDQNNQTYQLAKASLARTGDAPIHVQTILAERLQNTTWLQLLRPRHDIICSLDLIVADMDSLREILALWPNDSPAPSLRSCNVKVLKSVFRTDVAPPRVLSDQVHGQFLQNVASFSLCGGYFDWNSAAFANLEHLELVWIAEVNGPTLSQIANILRASPRLRTLCLFEVSILADEKEQHAPIQLDNLEKLVLMTSYERVWVELLPLLSLGPHPLTIHLGCLETLNTTTIKPLINLLHRSYVTSMYHHGPVINQALTAVLLAALPHLGVLYCSPSVGVMQVFKALSSPPSANHRDSSLTHALPCPQLHTIYLSQCSFSESDEHSWGPVTDQPNLTIELDNCFRVPTTELAKLASGTVTLKYLASRLPSFFPLDGIDHHQIQVFYDRSESLGPDEECLTLGLH
ncbi:hypothetical protein FRC07_011331 [Ceratobasidium sp. 392]|nr:hypothetical protein FRC07_011331 [Ceratobasidium sp. 392]